jgi:organic hydroperoxide reductase OsmC/OhrA
MGKQHQYELEITWTGNQGTGTSAYKAYSRSHRLSIAGKKEIACSSDSPFMGDPALHNPEDFFLASLSSCHMLWYLHLCADAGVVVIAYDDQAKGTLTIDENGKGRFTEVILSPNITVTEASMISTAIALHQKAHEFCFIANSCSTKISHHPQCKSADAS